MRLKKIRVALITLSICCSTAMAGQTHTLSISLDDALEIALSENLTVQVADQEIQKSEYAKKGTYAALFPTVDLTGAYQRTIEKQTMYMDTGSGSTEISVGTDNYWQGGVSASMPLVSVASWKSLAISAMDVELSIELARSSRIDLIEQVSNAYYGVLLAKESYDVYKEAYDNAVDNYNNVKQKYDVGTTSEYELIRADVSVKNAEPSLYSAENAIMLAEWQLKALLGIDLEMDIECSSSLSEYANNLKPSYSTPSLEDNSTLKQLEIQSQQLSRALEVTKAANLPTLSLAFSYSTTSMSNDFDFSNYTWTPYSIASLSLNIPIFAGGKRRSDIASAQVSIRQFELQQQEAERGLSVALLQYSNELNTCIKQYQAASSSVSQAEKGYNIAVRSYEIGNGTQLEINDSQLALTQARLNLNQSIYNYVVAQAAIDKLTGEYNKY